MRQQKEVLPFGSQAGDKALSGYAPFYLPFQTEFWPFLMWKSDYQAAQQKWSLLIQAQFITSSSADYEECMNLGHLLFFPSPVQGHSQGLAPSGIFQASSLNFQFSFEK